MEQALLPTDQPASRPFENTSSPTTLGDLLREFYQSARSSGSGLYTSWIEILLEYRSTALGPLWIPLGTALFVFVVGNLYGRVVVSGDSNVYLAHLAVGLVLWYFFNRTIVMGCRVFVANRNLILDGATTYTNVILKLVSTNLILLAHNVLVVILVFFYLGLVPSGTALLLLFTLPLVVANLLWICVITAILGTRYADFQETVQSALRLLFFVTPILWVPHQHVRGPIVDAIVYLNPFYYLIEVVRGPLVYGQIPLLEISVLVIALPVGWLVASLLYKRTRTAIALWL
jgi:ABC-type polysaccharide/polyol phosphate export permease